MHSLFSLILAFFFFLFSKTLLSFLSFSNTFFSLSFQTPLLLSTSFYSLSSSPQNTFYFTITKIVSLFIFYESTSTTRCLSFFFTWFSSSFSLPSPLLSLLLHLSRDTHTFISLHDLFVYTCLSHLLPLPFTIHLYIVDLFKSISGLYQQHMCLVWTLSKRL